MQKICLIIPCYNEQHRLPVDELSGFLAQQDSVTLLFVNDGSRDQTLDLLMKFCDLHPGRTAFFDQQPNAGKAEAVRQGMLHAAIRFPDAEFYGYWDADLSTPPGEITWFETISGGQFRHQFILGSRVSRLGARVQRKMIRHYLGRVFSTLASNLLRLPVYDTQCGAKLLHTSLIDVAFGEPFVTKWLFDVEIFARLIRKMGVKTVLEQTLEVPLREWRDIKGSKLHLRDLIRIPGDLLRIKRHYRL